MARDRCRNYHENCASWAAAGECESNYDYMWDKCAPVCQCCEELHYTARCPVRSPVTFVYVNGRRKI